MFDISSYMDEDRKRGRDRFAQVLKRAHGLVRAEHASEVLDLTRAQATQLLSRWSRQGWLRRIGPGLYIPVPVDAIRGDAIIEDPWAIVPELFGPAYIGGWSAAEHWDLTEQIFRDILVMSARERRPRTVEVEGITFALRPVREDQIFAARTVWRREHRVLVSDVHRTIVDMLSSPALGGGIQHVDDCLAAYLNHEDSSALQLIETADRLGNGAVFKRLGFLAERRGNAELAEMCAARLTQGLAQLDPSQRSASRVPQWRLRVPDAWKSSA